VGLAGDLEARGTGIEDDGITLGDQAGGGPPDPFLLLGPEVDLLAIGGFVARAARMRDRAAMRPD
jgi:hypothetical protein